MYPFIDAGTGGNINGMIAAANKSLGMVDASTKIVPGHGPLGDRAALTRYRDVLVTVRDRVQKAKVGGQESRGSGRGQAHRRVRCRVGHGLHAARRVRGDRLQHSVNHGSATAAGAAGGEGIRPEFRNGSREFHSHLR